MSLHSLAREIALLAAAHAAAVVLVAVPAAASEIFPPRIQKDLQLDKVPDCILCHETEAGQKNTVTKPFGISMRKAGLVAGNLGSLDIALQTLAKNKTDSDGDGVPDIDELRRGRNPNAQEVIQVSDAGAGADGGRTITIVEVAPPPSSVPLLETGCEVTPGARFAGASRRPVGALAGALAIATACCLRRANRRVGRDEQTQPLDRPD